jgi:hypothetical protein
MFPKAQPEDFFLGASIDGHSSSAPASLRPIFEEISKQTS